MSRCGHAWSRDRPGFRGRSRGPRRWLRPAAGSDRHRCGALFELVAGPVAGAARWRGLLVCALDGTTMFVPDSPANIGVYGRHGGGHALAGYPMIRLLAVVACGTRTVIDTVFGSTDRGETTYAPALSRCLRRGMLLLADRNFAVAALIEQITGTGARLLIRCKTNRSLPVSVTLPDGSWLSRINNTHVRVISADITVTCVNGPARTERYRLITTVLDPRRYPAKTWSSSTTSGGRSKPATWN